MYILIVVLVLSFLSTSGCLDTPAASMTFVDENALSSYGWSQVGPIEHNNIEQKISNSTSITINTTVVKYRNDRLAKDVENQVNDFKERYKLPDSIEAPSVTSEFHVNRITLPAGVVLPADIINRIVESKTEDLSSDNGIEDFRSAGTRQITLNNGLTVPVYTYTGIKDLENESLSVIGIVAVYQSEGASTVITGIVPYGNMSVNIEPVSGTLFTIDGESELEEMLKLISTMQ